jgi:hypothetical protein
VLGVNNVGDLGVKWSYDTLYFSVNSSPAVANGAVYVGSIDYNVYALNAKTGAVLWSYTTGANVDSSPAAANGVVYIGSETARCTRWTPVPAPTYGPSPLAQCDFLINHPIRHGRRGLDQAAGFVAPPQSTGLGHSARTLSPAVLKKLTESPTLGIWSAPYIRMTV